MRQQQTGVPSSQVVPVALVPCMHSAAVGMQ
jgi:hypothetical protein